MTTTLDGLPVDRLISSVDPVLTRTSTPEYPAVSTSVGGVVAIRVYTDVRKVLGPAVELDFSLQTVTLPSHVSSVEWSILFLGGVFFLLLVTLAGG